MEEFLFPLGSLKEVNCAQGKKKKNKKQGDRVQRLEGRRDNLDFAGKLLSLFSVETDYANDSKI
jgi:hypothetical protein